MVLRFVTKEGTKVYGPPYTKEEEADFYSRNANGPVTIARGAGDRSDSATHQHRRFCVCQHLVCHTAEHNCG